ncbi:hypothetical protein [Desulfovibrio inopinatus]|uniref:hypothetical protein n=1 Tax=Desulfovibrio inopinatus TaxID=102109 RepID=UPI0012EB6B22|nr:hypothetical protein [Desulfovibrio inopinatus]
MIDEKFSDGLMKIDLGRGVIRLDFYSLSADKVDAKGEPLRERCQRIILTPQGFVESFNMMQNVMDKFIESGLVHKQEGAQAQPAMTNERGNA